MSIRLLKIGRKQFALGLAWTESEESPKDALAMFADGGAKAMYVALPTKHGSKAIGYTTDKVKGRAYSFAAGLALTGADGIYAMPLEDGQWWYAVLSEGSVTQGTDVIVGPDDLSGLIRTTASNFGLDIFVSEEGRERLGFPSAKSFDPAQVLAASKMQPLTPLGGGLAQALGAMMILAVAGMGIWFAYQKLVPDPITLGDNEPTPEEIRAMYLASLRSEMGTVPGQIFWPNAAFAACTSRFPLHSYGLSRRAVTCNHGGCSATYEADARGIGVSAHAFAESTGLSVTRGQDVYRVNASIDVPMVVLEPADHELMDYPASGRALTEVVGTFTMRMSGVRVANPQRIPLHETAATAAGGMPPEAHPIYLERLQLTSPLAPDPYTLRRIAAYWGDEGFRFSSFAFDTAIGQSQGNWQADLVRLTPGP